MANGPGAPSTFLRQPLPPSPPYSIRGTMGEAADPAARRARLIQETMSGMNPIFGEADTWAREARASADALMGAYRAQLQLPTDLSNPMEGALPYAALAFASAMQGRPEVLEQADRTLGLRREDIVGRRTELLRTMHEQALAAAKQAENAEDVTKALQLNTKANLYLKQLEDTMAIQRGKEQASFESELRGRENEQAQRFQWWSTVYSNNEENVRALLSAGRSNPEMRGRLEGEHDIYMSNTAPLKDALGVALMGRDEAKKNDLMMRLSQAQEDYRKRIESIVQPDTTATPPAPVTPPGAGGVASPTPAPPARKVPLLSQIRLSGDSLRAVYPGAKRAAVLEELNSVDAASGKTVAELLAARWGVDKGRLLVAARRLPQ